MMQEVCNFSTCNVQGKRKLSVGVKFGNLPLEWQFLKQHHGVPNPLAHTYFGPRYHQKARILYS